MKQPYDIVSVLYGSETYYKNCPAYCQFHHKYLTIKQISQKKCLAKQCKCLSKIEHQYWQEREKKKQLRQGGKNEKLE